MPDLTMRIIINAQNNASGTFQNLSQYMSAVQPAANAAGAALMAVGAAVAYSTVQAMQFQQGLTTLVTGAGEASNNLQMVGDGIKSIAVATGTSTQDLIKAMFEVESANYRGAQGLQVLTVAAQGAQVGQTSLIQTADVLTTTMHDYGISASGATGVMNSLIIAVQNGKMTMDLLNAAMVNVLPVSGSLHVKLADVEGALSTMAIAGDKGASAGTHLAMMLKMLANPASTASKEMQAMGLDSIKLAQEMSASLPGALKMIQDAVAQHFTPGSVEYNRAIATILGGSKSGVAGLELMGKNLTLFQSNASSAAGSIAHAGSAVQGFAAVQQNASFKAAQAQQALQVLAITIGTKLLPVVSQILSAVTPLIMKFAQWASTIQANSPVLAILGGVLAGLAVVVLSALVPSLIAAAAGFFAVNTAIGPLWLIVLAVVAAVTIAILIFQHWGQICSWLQGVWSGFTSWLKSTWGGIGAWFQGILSNIGNFFKNTWNNIVNTAHSAGSNIQSWFSNTFNNLKNTASTQGNNLKNTMQGVWNAYVNGLQWMYNHNYYFKNAVDALNAWMQQFSAWWSTTWKNVTTFFETTWNTIMTWVSNAWAHIASLATSLWNTVTSAIQTAVTVAWNWLVSIWTTATTWLASKWNSFTQLAQTAWQAVSGVFASIWTNYIAGPLGSLWNSLSGWFGNLATQAVTWGKNIISGFISGIQSMLGAVGQAAQNIINTVAGYLGFHSPAKLGEGQHIIEWGQNAVKGFMQGMNNMQPQLQAQMQAMIQSPSGNTTNISRGNNTFHIHVNVQGSGNTGNDASQIATLLGNHVRAQFGNI